MSSNKPNAEISNIEHVDTIPAPEDRNPTTLYILKNSGVPERDRYLGAFMDRWSSLERAMQMLLRSLLKGTYEEAEVLFYSVTVVKAHTDMLTGLVVLKHPQQSKRWRTLAERILKLSTRRNHLVHGQWIPAYVVSVDEQDKPFVSKTNWSRVYMTGDPDLNARAIRKTSKAKTGQHQYTLQRIRSKIEDVVTLSNDIEAFRKSVCGEAMPPR